MVAVRCVGEGGGVVVVVVGKGVDDGRMAMDVIDTLMNNCIGQLY